MSDTSPPRATDSSESAAPSDHAASAEPAATRVEPTRVAGKGEDPQGETGVAATEADPSVATPSPETEVPEVPPIDLGSSMSPRFNLFFRWFARRFFQHFDFDDDTVNRLRGLEQSGAVVYVMRYSSRLDYFLFNVLLHREGLRLSNFANGIRFYYYRPLLEALRITLFRARGQPHQVRQGEDRDYVRRISSAGGSFFLFLRTARLKTFLRGRRRQRQDELDLLQELVGGVFEQGQPVSLVPVSVFWRKGPRSETRFLNLSYGALTRPSDILKVSSFLATYRGLSVKCGEPIDLTAFIDEHREEGKHQVARKVRRSLLAYLYREEKVVEGPTIRAPHRICDAVLADPGVKAAIEERSKTRRGSVERATADAEKIFGEIAANMNSTFLAVLGAAVGWIFRKMFGSIEVDGLTEVAENAKSHPIVLVPSHRSYFDFLILSWLFYTNFLVPPHIAARENMGFGPFGFIFRRAGAFFLRRSFDDPLYKEVFRSYVAYLVREGFTQEFFIEGGRSRTGKALSPRLGMLSWNVEAFLRGGRSDLLFVPVSITYERLVEESSMLDELEGGAKTEESVLGLMRARKYLQRRFGSVHLAFGEPISLADALGDRRARLARAEDDEELGEKRAFVEKLGLQIVERINWGAAANSTAVAACVLLGARHRGILRSELVARMRELCDLLRLQGVRFTAALQSDQQDFSDSITFLERADLVKASAGPRGEILFFEESRRRALDLYRNSIAHYLALPSILARRLLQGATSKELHEDVNAWEELLYNEFYPPHDRDSGNRIGAMLQHFEQQGWVEESGDRWEARPEGRRELVFLAEQTRGVIEAYRAVCQLAEDPELDLNRKALLAAAKDCFDHACLLGEAERFESANETTFQNAIELLLGQGILETRRVEVASERRRKKAPVVETHYAPGEHAERLLPLRARLDAALDGL